MSNPKQMSYDEFLAAAKAYGIDPAGAAAIMLQESKAKSFDDLGRPYILFERHYFYKAVVKYKGVSLAKELARSHPTLCNASATPAGGYGTSLQQWAKFDAAKDFCREAAIESCSWGVGQVMGAHWKSLDYESPQAMLNAMFRSEASQVEAIFRYLKANGLIKKLNDGDVTAVARGYNGAGFKKNSYDVKLAAHLKKCRELYGDDKLGTLEVFK